MRALLGALALTVALTAPTDAYARAKVEVGTVEFSDGAADKNTQKRLAQAIRRRASRASKQLDFGKTGRIEISFLVRDLKIEDDGEVVQVTCTLVGKLKGGGSARSKIRFGGKPDQRRKVERDVIAAATEGVVTRLAELARQKAKEDAK